MTPSCATTPRNGATLGGRTNAYASRRDPAEERRPEQDAGDDLADDRRLAEPPEQPAEQPADDDDRRQREQQMRDRIVGAHPRATARRSRRDAASGAISVSPQRRTTRNSGDRASEHDAVGDGRPTACRSRSVDGHQSCARTSPQLRLSRASSVRQHQLVRLVRRPGRRARRRSTAGSAACPAGRAIPSAPRPRRRGR